MSDTATSGEAPVAPAETVSAPPAPVANTTAQAAPAASFPTFGNSRGSGLARGKRASTPATSSNSSNTTPAASGEYTPTAIQIITTEREYKNPFAPEPAPEPITAPAAPAAPVVEAVAAVDAAQPAAAVVAPEVTPAARPAPVAEIPSAPEPVSAPAESAAPVASTEPAEKAELKILPPENKVRPAQSWESSSFPSGGQQSNNTQNAGNNRGGDRPIFRTERHRQRDAEAAQNAPASGTEAPRSEDQSQPQQRRDFREQRQPRDPRDQREPRQPRDPRDAREPRQPRDPRDSRGFNKPQSGTTPPVSHTSSVEEKKSGGLISWIKGLFSGEPAAPEKPADQSGKPAGGGERRFDRDGRGGGGRRNHRGGRGGQGNRGQGGQGGGFRGENRGSDQPRTDGQPGGQGQNPGGEHRSQGGHGGDRNHHRGGRGQRGGRGGQGGGFRGERRGGEGRPSDGGSSGPAAS